MVSVQQSSSIEIGEQTELLTLGGVFFPFAVQVPLLDLAFHIKIVTELALVCLLAVPRFEEDTQECLGIHTERDLLHLDGFQKRRFLSSSLVLLELGFFSKIPLFLLIEYSTRFTGQFLLLLDRGNLLLDFGGSVFLLHTPRVSKSSLKTTQLWLVGGN